MDVFTYEEKIQTTSLKHTNGTERGGTTPKAKKRHTYSFWATRFRVGTGKIPTQHL